MCNGTYIEGLFLSSRLGAKTVFVHSKVVVEHSQCAAATALGIGILAVNKGPSLLDVIL